VKEEVRSLKSEIKSQTSDDHKSTLRDRTKMFAISIIRFYSELPRTTECQVIGRQLLRSGTSVAANYRETARARSKMKFISKMQIALQEADETQFWIECLKEGCDISGSRIDQLWQESDELIRIFTASTLKAKGAIGA